MLHGRRTRGCSYRTELRRCTVKANGGRGVQERRRQGSKATDVNTHTGPGRLHTHKPRVRLHPSTRTPCWTLSADRPHQPPSTHVFQGQGTRRQPRGAPQRAAGRDPRGGVGPSQTGGGAWDRLWHFAQGERTRTCCTFLVIMVREEFVPVVVNSGWCTGPAWGSMCR